MAFTIDGLKEAIQDVVQFPDVISSAFSGIKNMFNEVILFFYYFWFFVVFLLYVTLAIGFFVVLPIYLLKLYQKNKKYIDDILFARKSAVKDFLHR